MLLDRSAGVQKECCSAARACAGRGLALACHTARLIAAKTTELPPNARYESILLDPETGNKEDLGLPVGVRKLERDLRLLRLEDADRPDDPFTLFNLGSVYQELGRHAEALPLLRRSLEKSHPRDSIVRKLYALIAGCQRQLGHTAEALAGRKSSLWATLQEGDWCPF